MTVKTTSNRLSVIRDEFVAQYHPTLSQDVYALQTPVGGLTVTFSPTDLLVIYTRYENPSQAKYYLSCNPFSGKYNYYGDSVAEFLNDLQKLFKR